MVSGRVMDMYFYFILLFCIIHNASPVPVDEEIQLTHYNPHGIKVNEKQPRNIHKEDSTDLNSDSRRFFNWVKNKHDKEIQIRNFNPDDVEINEEPARNLFEEDSPVLNNQSRKIFRWFYKLFPKNKPKRKTPHPKQPRNTRKPALNERIRCTEIEIKLIETLTNLNDVLTEILDIFRNHRAHDDIHEVYTTATSTTHQYHFDGHQNINHRFKRDSNKSNTIPKNINVNNGQESINYKGVNDSIDISPVESAVMRYENQLKIDPNKSSNIVNKKDENKNLYIAKVPTEFSEHNQNNQGYSIKQPINHTINDVTTKVESQELNKQNNLTTDVEIDNMQEKRKKRNAADLKNAVTEYPEKMEVEKVEVKQNGSQKTEVTDTTTDAVTIAKTGRRALYIPPIQAAHVDVKNRLFKYIDEAFAEIEKKTDYLKQIKQMFSKNVSYKIGYIISNIDTLEVNIRNMKRDMDRNKFIWDDKKILNVYDTVKVAHQAIADLLEILKNYVENSLI